MGDLDNESINPVLQKINKPKGNPSNDLLKPVESFPMNEIGMELGDIAFEMI